MTDPVSTAAVPAAMVSPVVGKVLSEIAPAFSRYAGNVARGVVDRTIVSLQLGFSEYLNTSYNRCRFFKTILNPQQPVEVLNHYVNVRLTCGKISTSDDVLINDIRKYKRVIITGLAGSGKSMFMKYFTLKYFEHPREIIPLFVELRHMNPLTDKNLLAFIRTSCVSSQHNVTAQQFDLSLRAGAFLLILDGFDEIKTEHADEIEHQILEIEKNFPETTIVVSSRPESRFSSWRSFFEFKVDELTKAQVVKLIDSLDYDTKVKKRFVREVRARLFDSHGSFLKYPLLASIMLLTYEEFAEIPQKMHAFYGQAFDTLFQKHDAQKDQFQRSTSTGLTREEFKRCFSALCAMSYLEEQFSFTERGLNEKADRAIEYTRQSVVGFSGEVTGGQLIEDLFRVVCMLQPDGVELAFVHRSFQEYFAALFLINLHGERVRKFIDRIAGRYADSVLTMAADMAPELIEKEWVLPSIEVVERVLFSASSPESIGRKLSKVVSAIGVANSSGPILHSMEGLSSGCLIQIDGLSRLYPQNFGRDPIFMPFFALDRKFVRDKLLDNENKMSQSYKKWESLFKENVREEVNEEGEPRLEVVTFEFCEDDDWWLERLGVGAVLARIKKGVASVRRGIESRDRRRGDILEEFI